MRISSLGKRRGLYCQWIGAGIGAAALVVARSVSGQISIMDLGTLGGPTSGATGIDDGGWVVGAADTAGDVTTDPFLWSPNGVAGAGVTTNPQMMDLASPLYSPSSSAAGGIAVAINALGQVACTYGSQGTYQVYAFLWTSGGSSGSQSNPQFQNLGTLEPDSNSSASGLNDHEQVVGGSTQVLFTQNAQGHGFLWSGNVTYSGNPYNPNMQDLGTNFSAAGINDSSVIAGSLTTALNNGNSITEAAEYVNDGPVNNIGCLSGVYNSSRATAINNNGLVVGTSQASSGALDAFLWTPNGTSGVAGNPQMQDLGNLGYSATALALNENGDVVGEGETANGALDAFLYTPAGGLQDLNSLLPAQSGWHLYSATGINDNGQIVGQALTPSGQLHAYLLTDPALIVQGPANLVWYNTPTAGGDGMTWDIGNNSNWNSSAGIVAYTDGSNVLFDDSTVNTQPVTLNVTVKPASVLVNTTTNSYTITGTGSIAGSGPLTLAAANSNTFTLATANSYTGGTFVNGGELDLAVPGALPFNSSLNISGSGLVYVYHNYGQKITLFLSSLNIAGTTDAWDGSIDLSNNDLVVENGSLATITNYVKAGFNAAGGGNWLGFSGIFSTASAFDTTHLTALGVIQNSVDGTPEGAALFPMFDGEPVTNADVLVKYTYYGDANLDGVVDASDYSRIDNGYLSDGALTGWFNGDFNYDGVINGSDYTLIDNAFNEQGAQLTAAISPSAQVTTQIAVVPEPLGAALIASAGLGLAARRRMRPRCDLV